MSGDTIAPFDFPAVGRKKLTAAFDSGRITSGRGVMLLGADERRLEVAERLAQLIADLRNPLLMTHSAADILRARMLAIACGYGDADDLDQRVDHPRQRIMRHQPDEERHSGKPVRLDCCSQNPVRVAPTT